MATTRGITAFTPEYIAEDSSPPALKVAYAFVVLETVTIVAYFTSRYIQRPKGYRSMPYFMVGSYLFSIGLAICAILGRVGGSGHHIFVIPPHMLVRQLKLEKAIELFYIPAISLPKIAILILYSKLFASHNRKIRYVCYATGLIVLLLLMYGLITPWVQCRPFAYNWNKTIQGTCFDIIKSYHWVGFPNTLTDVVMLLVSLPAIWRIQLPLSTKISLAATFMLGSLGLVTSILRFAEFFRNDIFPDYTYNGTAILIWSVVEPGVYFMCAVLLTLRPLFRFIFEEMRWCGYSGLSRRPTRSSKNKSPSSKASTSGLIHKENQIELAYSKIIADSNVHIQNPEPARLKYYGGTGKFHRLQDGGGDIEAGGTGTVHAMARDDPWHYQMGR